MNASRVALFALVVGCCLPAAPSPPPPVELALDRPMFVTAGQTYRVASTAIEITPTHFTPLDTPAGHVLTAPVAASDGEVHETLALHAYHSAFLSPTIWHGLSFQLSEEGFVYGGSTATITVSQAPTAPPPAPLPPATCMPPGLEASRALAGIRPVGCRFARGGELAAPVVVRTAEELAALIACDPGVTPPVIDLAASELYVVSHMLSPASGGTEIRDDGTTITFVTRFRSPCPDDPRPMPSPESFGFLLPAGASRTFHEASCTLPPRCP